MNFRYQHIAGRFHWTFLLPQYWFIWFASGFLIFLSLLPWAVQWRFAKILSNIAWKTLGSRRKTTLKNLNLCFPHKTLEEIELDAKQVFFNGVLGYFEAVNSWYSPKWFASRIHVHGIEHLKNHKGRGILLLGSHTTLLDAGGFVSSCFFNLDVVYRPQNNSLLNFLIIKSRSRVYESQIPKNDMKELIKKLKQGHAIWYSPDQDFGLKQGVMAPFFNVPAATLTAHRRLMNITDAVAIPLFFYRTGDLENPQYHVHLEPALNNFPSSDEIRDATRVNQILENQIKMYPTQYMWFHRRFKTRPNGEKSLY